MGLENLNIKNTLKEPTVMGKKTDKDFKQQIIKRDVNPDILKETDMLLKEDELSLKRKIFKLPKMEGLVHGDPKLSAVYEKLAVEGRDKYGYHWNETLMNIIFNDYVLNSPKYLQKYKMTVPIKKKRRDDSGINQIKKDIRKQKGLPPEEETKPKEEKNEGWDVERDGIRRTERTYDTMEENKKEVDETTGAAGAGSFAPALDKKLDETTTSSSSGAYSTAHAWAKQGEEPRMGKKPAWRGGVILESAMKDGSYLTDSNVFQDYVKALTEGIEDDLAGEGMTSPNDDSKVPMAEESMDEGLFDNVLQTKNKVAEILTANKDLFNKNKKLHEPMDDQNLVSQFVKNSTRVPLKQVIADPETYGQYLVTLLAQYALIVDRGLQNDPTVGRQLKTIGAIIDPQFLKTMANESVDMNEDHLSSKQDKIAFILQNRNKVFQGNVSPTVEQDLANMGDAEIDTLYQSAESGNGVTESESPITENFKGLKLNDALQLGLKLTYAKSVQEVRDAMRQFMAMNNISEEDLLDSIKTLRSNARMMASSGSQATENEALLSEILYYLTKETDWKEKIGESFNKEVKSKVEPKPIKTGDNTKQWTTPIKESMIDPQIPTMANGSDEKTPMRSDTTMVKEPQAPAASSSSSSAPAVSSIGGVGESLEESINKELAFYKKHLNELNQMVNEERRHPALVNLDRLRDANEKNFKSDIKDSNLGDIIDMESQPMSDELTTEVGENPYKLAQDIEKKSLQKTKGEALKNVGNSANEEGDEIPKRNLSKEEMTAVAMNRGKGMQDIVYDNKPSEKFEKRMEKDLGDDIYKLRKEKMEYQTNAPMYNKDAQPTFGDSKKEENNKYKKGYNNESISGKYSDEFGKKKFVDFKLNETVEIDKVDSTFQKVSTDGMGNTYTSKIQENQSYSNFSTSYDLFHKEGKIYRVKKSQSLNEGVEKQAPKVENMDKMKHLMGYKPSNYMVNKKIK